GDGCRIYGNLFESQIVTCAFHGNRGNGATLAHSLHGGVLSSLQLFGCTFEENEGHGAEIVRSYDVGFHGCAFRRNGRFGLLATNGCELVLACAFVDNHRSAFDFEDGGAGMGLRRYATLLACVAHSSAKQTHLIDADLSGSFARLVMVGCRAAGEGAAAAAGLAKLHGWGTHPVTIVGCQGAVTYAGGVQPVEIGGATGSIGLSADWRGANLLQMGDHRMWVDASGRLRLKNGAPTSDDDGRPVGGS
ncbi:MAG: right-handed parallel beta-helix repeat-containing protein, partial [Alphaproteobacteria bacterium]|nr:right-handed parallel beta-helix repeat-containing protein [Alphaproteobacteria bacterium]